MGKNFVKDISKNLSGKYSQKPIDHAKQSATDTFKTASKKQLCFKTAEATGDLIGNKITDKITKSLQQNNSETVKNEHDKEIPKDIYLQKKDKKLLIN